MGEFDPMGKWAVCVAVGLVVIVAADCLINVFGDPLVPFKPPSTVPVTGTVFVSGKPKAGVRVTYHPQFNIGAVKFTPNGITNSRKEVYS